MASAARQTERRRTTAAGAADLAAGRPLKPSTTPAQLRRMLMERPNQDAYNNNGGGGGGGVSCLPPGTAQRLRQQASKQGQGASMPQPRARPAAPPASVVRQTAADASAVPAAGISTRSPGARRLTVGSAGLPGQTPGAQAVSTQGSSSVRRPSARLDNVRQVDPFSTKKLRFASNFGHMYHSGAFPARFSHGSVNHGLHWTCLLTDVPADAMVTCLDGLQETVHPYGFVARHAFIQLLNSDGGADKALQVLPAMAMPLRIALSSSKPEVVDAALTCTEELASALGPGLDAILGKILPPLNRRIMDRKWKSRVQDLLHHIAAHGSPGTSKVIKAKVPTFS